MPAAVVRVLLFCASRVRKIYTHRVWETCVGRWCIAANKKARRLLRLPTSGRARRLSSRREASRPLSSLPMRRCRHLFCKFNVRFQLQFASRLPFLPTPVMGTWRRVFHHGPPFPCRQRRGSGCRHRRRQNPTRVLGVALRGRCDETKKRVRAPGMLGMFLFYTASKE